MCSSPYLHILSAVRFQIFVRIEVLKHKYIHASFPVSGFSLRSGGSSKRSNFSPPTKLDPLFSHNEAIYSSLHQQNSQAIWNKQKKKKMANKLQIQGDESVLLRVTHSNIKSFSADVRFSLQMTVEAVKEKLWRKCGTSVHSMSLELYDDTGAKVSDLADNSKPLGLYSPQDGFRVHMIDLDPSSVTSGGWLDDTSLVEKYKISDEAYEKRDGTFRKFKEKLGHQQSNPESKIPDNYMEDLCANIKVGDRCQVEPGEKRGVIKFVGQAETLAPGFWVGIQYDEPLGKHDGMVKGKRYFQCPPLCGGIVRPDKVKVGDFPERDPFEEDEI